MKKEIWLKRITFTRVCSAFTLLTVLFAVYVRQKVHHSFLPC